LNPQTGVASVYPWGDDWNPANLNACDASCLLDEGFKDSSYNDGQPQMSPVDSFPMDVSSLGVSDMGGNVAEWVADWYDAAYYAVAPAANPPGPASGTEKVVRGGSWSLDKNWARSTARSHFGALTQAAGIGFRCALTATP
jgi:formylglycine-generating enzyme required for sulfatase activity